MAFLKVIRAKKLEKPKYGVIKHSIKNQSATQAQSQVTVRKVVLAGAPNAGKTTLFNALTKSHLKTGNWHGVTVTSAQKQVGQTVFVDVPGMYAFQGLSMEEGCAARQIIEADCIINVIDAFTLEQNLALTHDLLSLHKPMILYVTKVSSLQRRGGRIDANALSAYLGVPVVMGDVARLRELLPQISPPQQGKPVPFASIYAQGSGELTRVEKILYNRYCALFCFILSVVLMFFLAFAPYMPGVLLKGVLEEAICVRLANAVSSVVKSTLVQSLLCEGVLSGVGGVLSFVPQIAILYLFLTLLEESGIMSALSFATDGIFQKVNLSGRAAFSLVSGFGCTAAAITTTKGYFSKGAQRRTVAVLAFIPCSAKMPVFLTFLSPLFANPFPVLCALYFCGILLAVVASKLLGGESEELLSEVTPIGIPAIKPCLIKLLFYVKGFIIKVVTTVFVFCLFSWFLAHFNFLIQPCALNESMLASISKLLTPLFRPIGITDWQISYALLTGLIAKENIAATIAMLLPQGAGLTMQSAVAICVFVLTCPACIAAFASSRKEVGLKFTLTYTIIQLITAFALSYAVYFIWGFFL